MDKKEDGSSSNTCNNSNSSHSSSSRDIVCVPPNLICKISAQSLFFCSLNCTLLFPPFCVFFILLLLYSWCCKFVAVRLLLLSLYLSIQLSVSLSVPPSVDLFPPLSQQQLYLITGAFAKIINVTILCFCCHHVMKFCLKFNCRNF